MITRRRNGIVNENDLTIMYSYSDLATISISLGSLFTSLRLEGATSAIIAVSHVVKIRH